MEKTAVLLHKDEEIRKILEDRREARRQKFIVRLGRNLANPLSGQLEALMGTLRSKKGPSNATYVEPKQQVTAQPAKVQLKRTLSHAQTATSLRRANLANGGVPLKRSTSFKSIPATKMPVAPLPTQAPHSDKVVHRIQKPKLTIPQSPNFTNRSRQQPPIPKPSVKSTIKAVLSKTPAAILVTKAPATSSKQPNRADGVDGEVKVVNVVNKRQSSSWMVPLTPEKKISSTSNDSSSAIKANPSPRTPNVKPFTRKSFSESKAPPNRSTLLSRSTSTAAIRPQSSFLARKSVAPSTLGRESRFSSLVKEPSDKEKVQNWLEKRGRSVASCRHVGCLGHQLKDFKVPEKKPSSVRKSIRTYRPTNVTGDSNANDASPQLKRKSERQSVLNTTFEKEDDDETEEVQLTPPPPPAFQDEPEEVVDGPATNTENFNLNIPNEETEEKFHTPEENKRDSVLDLVDLQEGRVDKLLETIAALFNEPVYPQEKIESWLDQSELAFPTVKTAALYWDIKARLQERRGNTMEALDIYNEALQNNAEPLDLMKNLFDNFLLRIGTKIPTGQRTPLLKSLGVETPRIRESRRLTVRRPLIDSSQAFNSSTVKYELKLKQVFRTLETHQENESSAPTPKTRSHKTPMRFTADASNVFSVAGDGPFELVATPVRRSMRPRSTRSVARINEQVLYVDDLEQLSPTTLAKAVVRKNKALASE